MSSRWYPENLTLRTLAALSTALDAQFDVQLTSHKPVSEGVPGLP